MEVSSSSAEAGANAHLNGDFSRDQLRLGLEQIGMRMQEMGELRFVVLNFLVWLDMVSKTSFFK